MSDDVIYAVLLVSSLLLGFVVRHGVTSSGYRRLLMTSVGVVQVVYVCGWNGIHSAIMAFVTACIVRFKNYEHCHVISFVWCFGYLAFFQTAHLFGFPEISGQTNALQILMALKLVGVAFEVHDSVVRCRDESGHLAIKYRNVNPSFVDVLCYSYCFIGLFTGPYFTFRTYNDLVHSGAAHRRLNSLSYIRIHYLWTLLACGAVYSALGPLCSLQYARSDEFYSTRSFWFQLFYMVPLFTLFRVRLYLAFIISECACVTSGLGGYPANTRPNVCQGPTDLEAYESSNDVTYDFTTIHNVDVIECELSPTMQLGIRTWNKTVQYWLAANVYKRLPFHSTSLRVTATMLVSAYWHGLHPGYYLTFLSSSAYLFVEAWLLRIMGPSVAATRDRSNNEVKPKYRPIQTPTGYGRWISWFLRTRASEYVGIGFEMKDLDATLRYWRHLRYAGHIALLLALLCCVLLNRWRQRVDKENRQALRTANDTSLIHRIEQLKAND